MLDFVQIAPTQVKRSRIEIAPKFFVGPTSDLMIRGGSFYAIWDEKAGLWSTKEIDVQRLIDEEIKSIYEKTVANPIEGMTVVPMYLRDFSNKKWLEWAKFSKTFPDSYHDLDSKLIFSNMEVKKEDYVTGKMPYPLQEGDCKAYEEIINTLYDPSERDKLEWAIGSIISGDSKKIQKFVVLYGEAGTGKSTIINIIAQLFPGRCKTFDAKSLAQANNAFSLEAFKTNPLVVFQHDGDLSRIEDNTKLNSVVSHEELLVNEKHKSQYTTKFNSFIFMGTNKPVKITEAKSGLLRRLIDVTPSGRKIRFARYQALISQIQFELGAIAYHCYTKYKKMGENYYDKYKPNLMFGATNDFYNFVSDNYEFFSDEEGVTLDAAWEKYKQYADYANFQTKWSRRVVKEELRNYFDEFKERDGKRYKVYCGFKKDKFDYVDLKEKEKESSADGCEFILKLTCTESLLDKEFADLPAQLAKEDESPDISWANVKTKLKDIDTKKLHYLLVPEWLIVIDFDLKDEFGNKDPAANLEAASKWKPTYAEFSKSGGGIHLHYIYDGDVLNLSRIYEPGIEIKVFKKQDGTRGFASLRRKLSFCNDLPIAHLNSGLPLKKGANDVVSFEGLTNEKAIRTLILRALHKEYCGGFTAPNVSLIYNNLEKAYENGVVYDVRDLRGPILTFASKSTNQSGKCIDLVAKMKFKSKEDFKAEPDEAYDTMSEAEKEFFGRDDNNISNEKEDDWQEAPIVFFDVEVFVNLLIICWKKQGSPRETTIRMINPSPDDVKALFKYRLIGFNNRRYDNHIIYAASLGYTNKEIYKISQGIITSDKKERNSNRYTFGAAYNLSYTDIYDFSSKKQSLKKWEIELGIHHQELGLPWDQPAPEELWDKVADYCVNDVMATEALFNHLKEDWTARQILADISGGTVNDTTNSLTIKLIFGNEKKPKLVYTDFATGKQFDGDGNEIDQDNYISDKPINYFPGYEMVEEEITKPGELSKKIVRNMFRGVDLGLGGYVYAEPGMYTNVALLDASSLHPTSLIMLNKLGKYTPRYADLRKARVLIKHEEYEEAGELFGGKLKQYLVDKNSADALSKALKLPLNSFFGISFTKMDMPTRDVRDKNNIIALRGALFMKTLQDEVTAQGYKVVHIKTDSIKIPDATPEIIQFVKDFGKKYGYEMEHECTYEKMCLVNDAVYIAKYDDKGIRNKHGKHASEWTATGTQFQQPFVFKSLFSKESITHKDVCETKEVSKGGGLYLDMNEGLPEGEHSYQFIGRVGQFCPIKAGCGGGILVREKDGKYNAVTGTKKAHYDKAAGEEEVYRWLESEVVDSLNKWEDVDFSYYTQLVDAAVTDISKYGDFEWFSSDDPVPPVKEPLPEFMNIPEDAPEELPFL